MFSNEAICLNCIIVVSLWTEKTGGKKSYHCQDIATLEKQDFINLSSNTVGDIDVASVFNIIFRYSHQRKCIGPELDNKQ